jgi:hypothetical protein
MVDAIRKRTTKKITSSAPHMRRFEERRRGVCACFSLTGRSPIFSIIDTGGQRWKKKHGVREAVSLRYM